jgi:hypothetical protein
MGRRVGLPRSAFQVVSLDTWRELGGLIASVLRERREPFFE